MFYFKLLEIPARERGDDHGRIILRILFWSSDSEIELLFKPLNYTSKICETLTSNPTVTFTIISEYYFIYTYLEISLDFT